MTRYTKDPTALLRFRPKSFTSLNAVVQNVRAPGNT